jgi:cytosine/adenosine deaminase-related metal-dependent hydrolase
VPRTFDGTCTKTDREIWQLSVHAGQAPQVVGHCSGYDIAVACWGSLQHLSSHRFTLRAQQNLVKLDAEEIALLGSGIAPILALQPVIATKVLGLDATGTLAPGMAADIALYALGDPRYFGLHDVAVGPVASGGRPALKGLWVNGQQVVENDVLRGVDVGELRAEARGAVRKLMAH